MPTIYITRHTVKNDPQAAGQEQIVTAPEETTGAKSLPTVRQVQATATPL